MSERYLIPDVKELAANCVSIGSNLFCFRVEESIKRSRFIASLAPAASGEAARLFVNAVKEEFPDATHNCWAYAAGPPGDTAKIGFSDDGEPQGTAGRPMLHALLHSKVGEVALVITRYFGGVKLGAGGLVRAYSGVSSRALLDLPVQEKIIPARGVVLLDYSHITQAKRLFAKYEASLEEEIFAEQARFVLCLPVEFWLPLVADLTELTAGQAKCSKLPVV